ncbi:methylmalonyl Co-A mutase-associated GTPase MeaB [Kineobactrum sediminis]|uniref:Methylmalonyl Co-A mutase-associated GTPase MeaB n=1 Tax=Kineobactrum sediminis TaxID=1905677 RepID=A0A2N5Y6L8_9GAMM|nr:methylmalonyl Co-A mutase-associated GTPase MeaB [Kineobactrum sediminis]PLW84021.1 methylmalonyl Co-A mutase-associated GTPase MeaB [Kineobactrum sediminis]
MHEQLKQQLEHAQAGDRGALARLISVLESGGSDAAILERCLRARHGGGYTVGITGAPGAGKSTLVSALLGEVLAEPGRVALLAVDPSSPLSRGALLGDRVRMQPHAGSPDVFIRSMASRGHLGGLAMATRSARRLLEACGWPLTLIETVGVGQVELDVASATDTVVVVLNPGWGDEVQANKAGLMEVADIFVINKADKAGLDATRRDLEGALASLPPERRPQVLETIATEGKGAAALWQAIRDHRAAITASGELEQRRLAQVRSELKGMMDALLANQVQRLFEGQDAHARVLAVSEGSLDIATASDQMLDLLYDQAAGRV